MDLSLWRGDRALGRIQLREVPTGGHISGVLLPEPNSGDLQSMIQTRLPIKPGGAVFQDPLEPEIVGQRVVQAPALRSGHVELKPLTDQHRTPAELQLRICDEDGADLPTQLIMLRETRRGADCVWGVVAVLEDREPTT